MRQSVEHCGLEVAQLSRTKEILSKNIRLLMATRGIRSNRELAKIMGVSETTVGRWVDGESCPTDERIDELAKIFDVQIHVLFTPHELTPLIN